jgi:hypothetical protein
MFGPVLAAGPKALVPPCVWIHGELKRHPHVTLPLQLLWEEYAGRFGAAAYNAAPSALFDRRCGVGIKG